MMDGGVVLCDVVCKVGSSSAPVSAKLLLVGPTAQPVKIHVRGFGSFGLDGDGDNAKGGGVVGLYGHGWLGMAHVYEEVALRNGFMCIYVECALAAEDITALMICEMVRTAPLLVG
jgi:hypothetical protein